MKLNLIYYLAGIVLFTYGCGCSKEPINSEETTTSNGQNLILNGSFENLAGDPSLNGWYGITDYGLYYQTASVAGKTLDSLDSTGTTYSFYNVKISNDVPINGRNYSLIVQGDGNSPYFTYVYYLITGLTGTNIYQLKTWAKCEYCYGESSIAIYLIKNDTFNLMSEKQIMYQNVMANWDQYNLIDTITALPQDTFAVTLYSQAGGPSTQVTLFDLIELVKIN